jgi:signal transduction histidine kinase
MAADGRAIPMMTSAVRIRGRRGAPSHVIVQAVDVSELHTANSQLRHLLQSREALIASVSHELRTPLTGVIGFAALLQDPNGRFSSAERAEMIQAIAKESADLSNIVEDLLTAAQVDFTNISMAQDAFDLREQAAQVIVGMGSPGAVAVERPRQAMQAMGNPARARQILRNLVVNAFRYGGESIRISFDSTATEARVEVRDDGYGVPEDMQDLIFEGFERGPENQGLTGSLGLGLALSRKLAELMNGTLTYHRQDGETVFRLSLPRADSAEKTASEEDPEQGSVAGSDVGLSAKVHMAERVASAEQPATVAPSSADHAPTPGS